MTFLLVLTAVAGVSAEPVASTVLTGVDRGVHDNFELLVFNCDRSSEFGLSYDRISGEVVVEVVGGSLSANAIRDVGKFAAGTSLKGAEVDVANGVIILRVKGLVHISQYIVSGPPALLLDISPASYTDAPLPFEMGPDEYLLQGGIREREGDYNDALRYLDHVRKGRSSDQLLQHRAGIIQHQLGRFEAALETFSHTARIPELAADAHARRSMIYLAQGDIAGSGREWAGYFHQLHRRQRSAPESRFTSSTASQNADINKRSSNFLKKLNINSDSKMMIGWGLLIVGGLTLIIILAGPRFNQNSYPKLSYNDYSAGDDVAEPKFSFNLTPAYPGVRSSTERVITASRSSLRPTVPLRMNVQVESLSRLQPRPLSPPPGSYARSSVILERSQQGADEGEIARELHVGRDEVAMVLNLARLAHEGQNLSRN